MCLVIRVHVDEKCANGAGWHLRTVLKLDDGEGGSGSWCESGVICGGEGGGFGGGCEGGHFVLVMRQFVIGEMNGDVTLEFEGRPSRRAMVATLV